MFSRANVFVPCLLSACVLITLNSAAEAEAGRGRILITNRSLDEARQALPDEGTGVLISKDGQFHLSRSAMVVPALPRRGITIDNATVAETSLPPAEAPPVPTVDRLRGTREPATVVVPSHINRIWTSRRGFRYGSRLLHDYTDSVHTLMRDYAQGEAHAADKYEGNRSLIVSGIVQKVRLWDVDGPCIFLKTKVRHGELKCLVAPEHVRKLTRLRQWYEVKLRGKSRGMGPGGLRLVDCEVVNWRRATEADFLKEWLKEKRYMLSPLDRLKHW